MHTADSYCLNGQVMTAEFGWGLDASSLRYMRLFSRYLQNGLHWARIELDPLSHIAAGRAREGQFLVNERIGAEARINL